MFIFEDLLNMDFLEIGLAHEYSHKANNGFQTDGGDEKAAFSFELHVAKLARKKQKWIKYNREEYTWQIGYMRECGLIR